MNDYELNGTTDARTDPGWVQVDFPKEEFLEAQLEALAEDKRKAQELADERLQRINQQQQEIRMYDRALRVIEILVEKL